MALIKSILLIALLAGCQAEWDPSSEECAQKREEAAESGYWKDIMDKAYAWVNTPSGSDLDETRRNELAVGCNEYEEVKMDEPYACWSKEFLCAAKNVILKTEESKNQRNNLNEGAYVSNRNWFDWFPLPEGANDWPNAWKQEKQMVIRLLWIDPKLTPFSKDDAPAIEQQLITRVYNYIAENNVKSFRQVYDIYNREVRDHVREQCDEDEANSMCKLTWFFDHIEGFNAEWPGIPIQKNPIKPPDVRAELGMLYLISPKVYKVANMDDQHKQLRLVDKLRVVFKEMYDSVYAKNGNQIKYRFGKFGSITVNSRQECDQTLNKDFTQLYCLIAESFEKMTTLTNALGNGYDQWNLEGVAGMRYAMLVWLLVTPTNVYVEHDRTVSNKFEVTRELFKIIYKKVKTNDISSLQQLATLMPTEEQLLKTTAKDCEPNFESIKSDLSCNIIMLIRNLALFLNQYKAKDEFTKYIDLSIDFTEKLKQVQIENVKSAVEESKLEIKADLVEFTEQLKDYFDSAIGERFAALETYFSNLATFDKAIATADIGYLTSRLDKFAVDSAALLTKLNHDASKLQFEATVIAGVNAAFKWMAAAGEAIIGFFSIFTGDLSGISATANALNEAAQATSLAILSGNIAGLINEANTNALSILNQLQENRDFLDTTKLTIDKLNSGTTDDAEFKNLQDEFLRNYNDYDPGVEKSEIARLTAQWENIVEQLEKVIDGVEMKEAQIGVAVIYSNNYIDKLKIAVPELMELFESRYDFQFELMDQLAATVRAHVAYESAKGLETNFNGLESEEAITADNEDALLALEQMALSTFITSQLHSLQVLVHYCDELMYANAGVMPSECLTAIASLKSTDIISALSTQPPTCDEVVDFLNINASEWGRPYELNLAELYSGKAVTFKVPSTKWLVDNHWISSRDVDKALYVKGFELIAIVPGDQRVAGNIQVEIYPEGPAPLYHVDGQRTVAYGIGPKTRITYVTEYHEQIVGSCPGDLITNPYYVCKPGPRGICFRSRGVINQATYPSIFSKWNIRMTNLENVRPPIVADGTNFAIKVRLDLCRKTRDANAWPATRRHISSKHRSSLRYLKHPKHALSSHLGKRLKSHNRKAYGYRHDDDNALECQTGKYYIHPGVFSACPAGSAPGYYSYYCEKDAEVVDEGSGELEGI